MFDDLLVHNCLKLTSKEMMVASILEKVWRRDISLCKMSINVSIHSLDHLSVFFQYLYIL